MIVMREDSYAFEDSISVESTLKILGKDKTYDILDFLAEDTYSAPELESSFEEISEATIYRRLEELEKADLVRQRTDETLLDRESQATKYSTSPRGEQVVDFFRKLY